MRCSTSDGFHGRSNSTRRRQNSKLRPSPPHSVDTSRLGPSGSRNRATSVSRRAGGQLLVEDAGRQLRPVAERRAQHLQRLAVRHEDERLLPRVRQRGACASSQSRRGSLGVHRLGLLAQRASRRVRARRRAPLLTPARGGRDRSSAAARHACRRRRASRRVRSRPRRAAASLAGLSSAIGNAHPRRQAADVGAAGGAGARRQRRRAGEARLETHVLGKLLRTEQLEQAEEPVGVVFERGRAQEQDVTTQARDRRDRPPAGLAGVAGRAAEPLRFVHHQQVDARRHGLVGQLRALDQHLQRDDGAAMHVERVEVGAEVARHVGEALRIEQREDLVVLPPELAQPLDGQRIRRDDEAAFDLPACTSRFRMSDASMVLPRPTSSASSQRTGSLALARSATWSWCGNSRTRPPRKEPRPSASRGPGGAGCRGGSRNPRPRRDRQRQPFEQRSFGVEATAPPAGTSASLVAASRSVVAASRKLDDQDSPFDRGDASGAKLRIEAVSQVGPDGPGMHVLDLTELHVLCLRPVPVPARANTPSSGAQLRGISRNGSVRSGSGIRLTGPRKNEPAAMKSATFMRHRWRFSLVAPLQSASPEHPVIADTGRQGNEAEHHEVEPRSQAGLLAPWRSPR